MYKGSQIHYVVYTCSSAHNSLLIVCTGLSIKGGEVGPVGARTRRRGGSLGLFSPVAQANRRVMGDTPDRSSWFRSVCHPVAAHTHTHTHTYIVHYTSHRRCLLLWLSSTGIILKFKLTRNQNIFCANTRSKVKQENTPMRESLGMRLPTTQLTSVIGTADVHLVTVITGFSSDL